MWFNIVPCLSGWCRKMHLCVDYFVTDSPAHSPGNVWRQSDFSLNFLTVPQRTENAEKTRLSRKVVFSFFWYVNDRSCHSQAGKSASNVLEKMQMLEFCLLHGVEWDRLIVHRIPLYIKTTLSRKLNLSSRICLPYFTKWVVSFRWFNTFRNTIRVSKQVGHRSCPTFWSWSKL